MTAKDPIVAVVTGSSRGAGRGIAIALGSRGATVYVTGRSEKPGDAPLPGTIHETAAAVTAAGGTGIAVRVEHGDDAQVEELFDLVEDRSGRLDILVNNATVIHDNLITPGGFWERPLALVDILKVGLRCHYVASYFAAPFMVRERRGLIVFTSSFGSACYMHGPAYGAQKAGVDKFAADMAVDLKDHDVAAVSIWMGPLLTERTKRAYAARAEEYSGFVEQAETPEFTGQLVGALYDDPDLMALSGQTLIGAELAARYGITDSNGRSPPSYRAMLGEPHVPHPAIVR